MPFSLGLRRSGPVGLRRDNPTRGRLQSGWQDQQKGADDDLAGDLQAQSGGRFHSLNGHVFEPLKVANYQNIFSTIPIDRIFMS